MLSGKIYEVILPRKKLKKVKVPEISPYGDIHVLNQQSKAKNFLFHNKARQPVPKMSLKPFSRTTFSLFMK